jgi:hypothetical protein
VKRGLLAITLFFTILVIAFSQFEYSFFASANWVGAIPLEIEISPQSVGANPPTITILSPEEGKAYGSNVSLHCNISLGDVTSKNMSQRIDKLYYQEDWENSNTIVTRDMAFGPKQQWNEQSHSWDTMTVNVNFNLTEFSTDLKVPTEGKHSITVWAIETGSYQEDTGKRINGLEEINIYTFHITSSKTVTFKVDNSAHEASPEVRNAPTFPLVPIVAASVVTIGLTASVVLVYFRRKRIHEAK